MLEKNTCAVCKYNEWCKKLYPFQIGGGTKRQSYYILANVCVWSTIVVLWVLTKNLNLIFKSTKHGFTVMRYVSKMSQLISGWVA